MSANPEPTWTPESYLAFERTSDEKHEYLDGQIYAMVGATRKHNQIVASTVATLHSQILNRPCGISTLRLRDEVESLDSFLSNET